MTEETEKEPGRNSGKVTDGTGPSASCESGGWPCGDHVEFQGGCFWPRDCDKVMIVYSYI